VLNSVAQQPGLTVTQVATSHGFVELGRFAVQYRAAFGEKPVSDATTRADAVCSQGRGVEEGRLDARDQHLDVSRCDRLGTAVLRGQFSQPSRAAVRGMSYQDLLRDPDFTRAVKTIAEQCSVNVDLAKLKCQGG
jgi:hypothetical protein